jgi:hypothetical protein
MALDSPFDAVSNRTFAIYVETILEVVTNEYKSVISLDIMPCGPISKCVFLAKHRELSEFRCPISTTCRYYLTKYPLTHTYMERSDIPKIYSYLVSNGYIINTELTELYRHNNINTKELVCVVNYEV